MPVTASYSTMRTHIAGIPVPQLAVRFGTPVYVYDAAKIGERVGDLKAFDHIRYAQKACSNLAILALVRRQGVLVDAVSAGEIQRALAAGYVAQGDPPPVVYTADIFDRESLESVAQHGIHVNCGSLDMLDQLAQRCGGRQITLRINPGFGHGHSQKTNTGGDHSKHGIWHEQLGDCLSQARRLGHKVVGVHVHIGSGTDFEHLAQVCGAVEKLALQVGDSVTSISAGGGLPIPYRDGEEFVDIAAYHELWNTTRRKLEKTLGHALHLEIEPGRYLVAESGYLISEIRAVKRMGANTFYLVDAGFNNLARPILYGAYHPMSICPATGTQRDDPGGDKQQDVVIGGPLCESGDIFTQSDGGYVCHRRLPVARLGDFLIIECAGAYGYVMASNYNSKPLVAEVLVRDGQAHLIRARQTFEDVIRGEAIPS
jgi:diaminopimelate decarboxylase